MDERGTEPESVGLRFLSSAYWLRRTVDQHMIAAGLSLARAKVLQVLDRCGPLRQAALAAELGFAARSITQTVESMEGDGLVARCLDPDDGRAKLVTLTGKGAAALAEGVAAGEHKLRQIFDSLDRDQLAGLDALLDVIETSTASVTR